MPKIEAPARMEHLENLLDFVEIQVKSSGFSEERAIQIRLAAEEALVNVICHAYPEEDGHVALDCKIADEGLVVEIRDKGVPYNPLTKPGPDIHACLEDRCPGGLGIHFIREMATKILYRREDGQNCLTLVFAAERGKV